MKAVVVPGSLLSWCAVSPVRRQEGEGRRWQEASRRGDSRHRGEEDTAMVLSYDVFTFYLKTGVL